MQLPLALVILVTLFMTMLEHRMSRNHLNGAERRAVIGFTRKTTAWPRTRIKTSSVIGTIPMHTAPSFGIFFPSDSANKAVSLRPWNLQNLVLRAFILSRLRLNLMHLD